MKAMKSWMKGAAGGRRTAGWLWQAGRPAPAPLTSTTRTLPGYLPGGVMPRALERVRGVL